ncbi:hypothetical protein A2G69_07300 [Streptococcus pneumoniae]|nr:hypothetical protein A2G69_07300 [Streptococcus pneumoniae]
MNYEASKQLTDARFKRLVGVQRTTFEEMLAVLKTAYQKSRTSLRMNLSAGIINHELGF